MHTVKNDTVSRGAEASGLQAHRQAPSHVLTLQTARIVKTMKFLSITLCLIGLALFLPDLAQQLVSAQTGQASNPAAKSAPSSAQAGPDEPVFTVRKTVNEVHLVFSVTDKHGRYIKDMKRNDFKILDDQSCPKRS